MIDASSDAEADVNLSFGGLATLIRHASIDMGIEIVIELEEVRKSTTGLSRKKCALGKIRYPKVGNQQGETGHLLYIKSSISGTEAEYIREYRTRNADFPHETTGDQFFDETQFEAYRALGYNGIVNKADLKAIHEAKGRVRSPGGCGWQWHRQSSRFESGDGEAWAAIEIVSNLHTAFAD